MTAKINTSYVSDYFTLTHDSVVFKNQVPGTRKAKMTVLKYPASGDVWAIIAVAPWTFSVQKIHPVSKLLETAYFKTIFDNGQISFIIDSDWSDYIITKDPNSYLTKGLPARPDPTEFQVNDDLQTEHGVIVDPNPSYENPIEFIDASYYVYPYQSINVNSILDVSRVNTFIINGSSVGGGSPTVILGSPIGKVSQELGPSFFDSQGKQVTRPHYIFTLLKPHKRGTYLELRVDQNDQFNQTVGVGINDDFQLKVLEVFIPFVDYHLYSAWNPGDKSTYITLSNSDLTMSDPSPGATWSNVRSVKYKSSDKWYWEITPAVSDWDDSLFGVANLTADLDKRAGELSSVAWQGYSGAIYINNAVVAHASTWRGGDVLGIALDATTRHVSFYKNGVFQATIDLAQGIISSSLVDGNIIDTFIVGGSRGGVSSFPGPYYAIGSSWGDTATANFGALPFAYPVPAGYNPGLYDLGSSSSTINLSGVQATFAEGLFTSLSTIIGRTYATWDPAYSWWPITLSGGNLTSTHITTNGYMGSRSTISRSSGKWYWEINVVNGIGDNCSVIGFGNSTFPAYMSVGGDANSVGYINGFAGYDSGKIMYNNAIFETSYYTYTSGDIIGVALDADAKTLTIYNNGVLQGTSSHAVADDGPTSTDTPYYALASNYFVGNIVTANFGAAAFTYPVPAGYNPGLYCTYSTLNPSDMGTSLTLSGGNLILTGTANGNANVRSTVSKSSGKWYWEATMNNITSGWAIIGVANASYGPLNSYVLGSDPGGDSVGYWGSTGGLYWRGSPTTTIAPFGTGDVIGIAMNLDVVGTDVVLLFYKNGNLLDTLSINGGMSRPFYVAASLGYQNDSITMNFGATPFVHPAPAGFNPGFYD